MKTLFVIIALYSSTVYGQDIKIVDNVNKFIQIVKTEGRIQLKSEISFKGILLRHTPGSTSSLLNDVNNTGDGNDSSLLWAAEAEEKHRPTGGDPNTLRIIKDLVMIPGLNGGKMGYLCRYEVEYHKRIITDIYYNEIDDKGKWK